MGLDKTRAPKFYDETSKKKLLVYMVDPFNFHRKQLLTLLSIFLYMRLVLLTNLVTRYS
jgi:hypothetical protein